MKSDAAGYIGLNLGGTSNYSRFNIQQSSDWVNYYVEYTPTSSFDCVMLMQSKNLVGSYDLQSFRIYHEETLPEQVRLGQIKLNNEGTYHNIGGDLVTDGYYINTTINHESTQTGSWPFTFTALNENAKVTVYEDATVWRYITEGTPTANVPVNEIYNPSEAGATNKYWVKVELDERSSGGKKYTQIYDLNMKNSNLAVRSAVFQLPATKSLTIGEGYSQDVVVKVTLSDGTEHNVETSGTSWNFANSAVANQVTGTRVVAGYSVGTTTFTMSKYGDDNTNYWSFQITGKQGPEQDGKFKISVNDVTSQTTTITVSAPTVTFSPNGALTKTLGDEFQPTATITYSGPGTNATINFPDDYTLSVTSSNTDVATVGSSGWVTANTAGTSTITAQIPEGTEIKRKFPNQWNTENFEATFTLPASSATINLTVEGPEAVLVPVSQAVTWAGNSWTPTYRQVVDTYSYLIRDANNTYSGYTLKALGDEASDIKWDIPNRIKFQGGLGEDATLTEAPVQRAIIFQVKTAGKISVNFDSYARGTVAANKIYSLNVSYVDKDGYWYQHKGEDAYRWCVFTNEFDPNKEVIIPDDVASEANPATIYLYTNIMGLSISSITWTPITADQISSFNLQTNSTAFATTVGAKWTNKITIKDSNNQPITKQGHFIVTGTKKISVMIDETENCAYIVGEEVGDNIKASITWKSNDGSYTNATKTFTGSVTKGNVTMTFVPSSGEIVKGRSFIPTVVYTRGDGKEVSGLSETFSSDDEEVAKVGTDGMVTGVKAGTAIITASFAGNEKYEAASTAAGYSLTVINNTPAIGIDKKDKEDRLVMIPYTLDYYSPNMADYWWYDEAGGDDNIRNSTTVPMVRLHTYLSSDNRFRIYSTANDEVIDNASQKGVMLKDSRSWIEFYAQGTATLTVKGYATTPRVLELYAVNDTEYDKYDKQDPDFSTTHKVGEIVIPKAGPFTISRIVSQPGKNYYFLKTSVGGIYISTIDWTGSLRKPYITIENVGGNDAAGLAAQNGFYDGVHKYINTIYSDLPGQAKTECHYALDHTTGHMRVIETNRLKIEAWTFAELDGSGDKVNITVPAWPNTTGTNMAKLTFGSSDETVAKVDETGLIIPMSQGVCKIYVYLQTGSVTVGSTEYTYGAQRAEFWLHINSEAVDVDFVDNKNGNPPTVIEEVLYSPYTSTSMTWPQVFVTKFDEWTEIPEKDSENNANYTLTYHLLDEYGKTLESPYSTYISINSSTGVLTFNDTDDEVKEKLDDKKFRVAVEMSSTKYVNQRTYYILKYTNGLTIPTVKFHSEGMKELSDAKGVKATKKQDAFNKYREYFARAEEDVTLTFTIPETTTGMTSYYKVYDELPAAPPTWSTTNDGSTTGNTFTVNIDAPNSHCSKFVCVHMEKGSAKWDGVYMITFFKMPKHTLSGSPTSTSRTATITSNNTAFNNAIYYEASPLELHYTTDTSDPTADDKKPNAQGKVTFSTNTILRYIEVFVAPHGMTLTDEYGSSSTTFATGIPDDVKIAVKDDNVFYTGDYGTTDSKFPTEANMFTVATSGTPTAYQPSATNYKVTFMPTTATGFADAELIVMFGSTNAPIYRESQFLYGGHHIPTDAAPAKDDGIKSYIDIYDKFVKSEDMYKNSDGDRKKLSFKPDGTPYKDSDGVATTYTTTGNPNTEWNTLMGGVIHDRRPQGGLYLTPVSGDFIRFEAEYSGIVSVWLRSNGSTASNATKNVNAIKEKYTTETTEISYTNKMTNETTTMSLGELKRTIEKMEQADLTRRPVYIMDENGKIMQRNTMAYSYDSYDDINGVVADISMQSKFGTDLDHAWNYNQKYYYDSQALDDLIALTAKAVTENSLDSKYSKNITDYKKKLRGESGSGGRNYIDDMQFYADKYAFDLETTEVNQNYKITEVIYCDNAAETRSSFAKYGFELPNSNYIRYRFPVTAGKSYYIGGRGTKNFFSAMKFEKNDACKELLPDADSKAITANILDGTETDKATVQTTHAWMSAAKGTQMNVAVKRTFEKDKWHPIVLPFSVSESRMREIFGKKVRVLMLDEAFGYDYKNPAAVQGSKLTFTRHYYQMLYANVPAYVCPSKDVYLNYKSSDGTKLENNETGGDCVLFERVTYEGNEIRKQEIGAGFQWVGSYLPVEAEDTGDMYYMSNKENSDSKYKSADGTTTAKYVAKLYHAKDGQKMLATRCWIKAPAVTKSADVPELLSVSVSGFNCIGSSEDSNFEIEIDFERDIEDVNIVPQYNDPRVYNLQGVIVDVVSEDNSFEAICRRLPGGVYI